MEQIQVGRWLFWAGVLLLVATIVLSTLYGQQSNPPYGTGWDFIPVLVTVAFIILLASAVGGDQRETDVGDDRAESPAGTR